MNDQYTFESERLLIRPLHQNDLEIVRVWRNNDDIRRWFLQQRLISPEEQRHWFEQYKGKHNDRMFMAVERSSRLRVGTAALYNIQPELAEFGRLIINPARGGQGLGAELTEALCQFGFHSLKLSKIVIEVISDNYAALKIYEKYGFRKTGAAIHENRNVILMERDRSFNGKESD
ncbi:N-acetyltransferase [Paenibacillaceae bacterium]|nr:N-acetyltransferase [Paenibacillaceae bacterium]